MEKIKILVRKRGKKWRDLETKYDVIANTAEDDAVKDKAWRIRTIYYGRYNECISIFEYNKTLEDRKAFHSERILKQIELVKSLENGNIVRYCRELQTLSFYKAMYNEYIKIYKMTI